MCSRHEQKDGFQPRRLLFKTILACHGETAKSGRGVETDKSSIKNDDELLNAAKGKREQ